MRNFPKYTQKSNRFVLVLIGLAKPLQKVSAIKYHIFEMQFGLLLLLLTDGATCSSSCMDAASGSPSATRAIVVSKIISTSVSIQRSQMSI